MLDSFKKAMQRLEPIRRHRCRKPYYLLDILPESSLRPHKIELENTEYLTPQLRSPKMLAVDKKGQEVDPD